MFFTAIFIAVAAAILILAYKYPDGKDIGRSKLDEKFVYVEAYVKKAFKKVCSANRRDDQRDH